MKELTELEPPPKKSINARVESAGYGRKSKRTSDGGDASKVSRGAPEEEDIESF
jgi:hypothetical protein